VTQTFLSVIVSAKRRQIHRQDEAKRKCFIVPPAGNERSESGAKQCLCYSETDIPVCDCRSRATNPTGKNACATFLPKSETDIPVCCCRSQAATDHRQDGAKRRCFIVPPAGNERVSRGRSNACASLLPKVTRTFLPKVKQTFLSVRSTSLRPVCCCLSQDTANHRQDGAKRRWRSNACATLARY